MFPRIKSTLLLAIFYVDVHQLLSMHFPTNVYHTDLIQSLGSSVTSITIPNWTCNDPEYTKFDFSRFTLIESIEIGNDCFGFVKTFCLDGFQRLQTLKIGSNSFTQSKHDNGNDPSKSFHVRNCQMLRSIEIGEFSFADFAEQFELKSLPSLESIKIGAIGSKSYNFYYSSFVIQSIVAISIIIGRSSTSQISFARRRVVLLFSIDANREYGLWVIEYDHRSSFIAIDRTRRICALGIG